MNKSILSFTAVLLIISLLGVICFTGVDFGFFAIPPITDTDEGVRLGLDLVGGLFDSKRRLASACLLPCFRFLPVQLRP